jgi:NAD(P)H-flavin reductase
MSDLVRTPDDAAPPDPMVPAIHRVRRTRQETPDTWTLELEPVDGDGQRTYAPGQFNMLYVFGVGEAPISISGDPTGPPGLLAHTVRAVGAVTRALCALRRGDLLGVRGPFGNAWPIDQAAGHDVLLVAGGVGLAPLRSAFCRILGERSRFGRVSLLYGARSPRGLVFADDLRRWRARFDVEVEITVDHAVGPWRGHVGVVTQLLDYAPIEPEDCVALLCGPEVMMRYVGRELGRRGLPAERTYVSLERNMRCGIGLCGHCQLGGELICRDGPVYSLSRIEPLLRIREL